MVIFIGDRILKNAECAAPSTWITYIAVVIVLLSSPHCLSSRAWPLASHTRIYISIIIIIHHHYHLIINCFRDGSSCAFFSCNHRFPHSTFLAPVFSHTHAFFRLSHTLAYVSDPAFSYTSSPPLRIFRPLCPSPVVSTTFSRMILCFIFFFFHLIP